MTNANDQIKGAKLYGVSLSPFVRKVRAVLALKGIDYELVNVMPGAMTAEFRAISPLAKVPVWEEEGFSLPDSSVICAYLDRRVPSPTAYPEDPQAFARDLFWEEYADTRLVEAASPVFFQRIVRGKIFKETPDENLLRRNEEELLPPVLDQLETLFVGRDGYDGSTCTVGGLGVWSACINLSHAGYEIATADRPGLAAFVEKISAHPPLSAIVEEERAAVANA